MEKNKYNPITYLWTSYCQVRVAFYRHFGQVRVHGGYKAKMNEKME